MGADPGRDDLLAGNRRAEEVASRSRLVMGAFRYLRANAITIAHPELRKQVLEMLDNPAPTFYREWPTPENKQEVCNALMARGFIKARDDLFPDGGVIDGVFPPTADPRRSPQRFWVAPGGSFEGHHSYPGGLVIHEAFNLRSALSLAANYRAQYPGMILNNDYVIAAPIWHDAMKALVFQWKSDGSELPELVIAGTGAHHILGIAEALHRRLPPALVVAIAAAHGTPGFEPSGKIVDWLEAAALLAHVDPVEYGVLRMPAAIPAGGSSPSPKLELPWPISPEATINNLSDGDFVLSITAARFAVEKLGELARSELKMSESDLHGQRFNEFRNRVFSQITQERFYSLWLEGSSAAVLKEMYRLGLIARKQ
ncbi:MAG: metal-dependent phosphohydrolase [Acidobacteriia bacterium]|nr:metal-dependent phosphohydrolase [Terriglobia bacterium]